MTKIPLIQLNDGNKIPQIEFGTWLISDEHAPQTIELALAAGYRAIDTAAIYNNETGIGKALKASGLAREDLFITTKLWNSRQGEAAIALQQSLEKLQLDYVDLYLIHWPMPKLNQYLGAWQDLIKLQQQGLIKSIGVSNFNPPHLEHIIKETGIVPVVNQIELHPFLQQAGLRNYLKHHNIAVQAWSPLFQGGNAIFDVPIFNTLAQKYNKTAGQIILRWHLDIGNIVIPKSTNPSRIKQNINIFDFQLNQQEIELITAVNENLRRGPTPEDCDLM